jgi:CRP-like cAMP-binding protein
MSVPAVVGNRLLARVSVADRQRLDPICERVNLEPGVTLWAAGTHVSHVYFPLSGFISSVLPMEEGIPEVETVCTGDEGMVGVSLLLGISYSAEHVLVQSAGRAIRAKAADFERELARTESMRGLLQRYLFVLTTQLAQNIACSHHHLLEPRFARWLLMAQDRSHSPEFYLTQEFIANMLGVHRPAVSEVVRLMQERGLINHSRGQTRVVDREALEAAACSCYAVQKAVYERFLGGPAEKNHG